MAADEATRERIVAAADALFYARGVQSVGMDDVRAAAGVSLKRIYAEFTGKEQLLLAVLDRRHRGWEASLAAASASIADPRARLLAVYDVLDSWFADDGFRGCGFINVFGELGAVSPQVAEATRDHKRSFQQYVARLVQDAGGPADLAPQLALLAEGAQTTAAIDGSTDAAVHARRAAEVLVDVAFAAV